MNADWRGFAFFLFLSRARFRESFKRIGHQHRGANYSRNEYELLFLFLSKLWHQRKGGRGERTGSVHRTSQGGYGTHRVNQKAETTDTDLSWMSPNYARSAKRNTTEESNVNNKQSLPGSIIDGNGESGPAAFRDAIDSSSSPGSRRS